MPAGMNYYVQLFSFFSTSLPSCWDMHILSEMLGMSRRTPRTTEM